MDRAFVYIVLCADGSFYTGITRRSVEARVSEHNSGRVSGYTCARRPVTLVYHEAHTRYDEAVAAERRIKDWSRVKKMALIRSDFDALHELAKYRPRRDHATNADSSDAEPTPPPSC